MPSRNERAVAAPETVQDTVFPVDSTVQALVATALGSISEMIIGLPANTVVRWSPDPPTDTCEVCQSGDRPTTKKKPYTYF